jgi:hypothetical protein
MVLEWMWSSDCINDWDLFNGCAGQGVMIMQKKGESFEPIDMKDDEC